MRDRATIILVPIANRSASTMSLMERLEEKRDDILKIASQHGAFNVRVFGSVVRKEETEANLNGIDLEQVWNAVTLYLPSLELAIKRFAANLSQDNN